MKRPDAIAQSGFGLGLPSGAADLAFALAAAMFMGWARWHAIVFPLALNPDEAQFAATAMRIPSAGFSWNAIDDGTSGPINSLVLAWPYLFGGDVTLSTTRLTALVLLWSIVVFLYLAIKATAGRQTAMLLTLPVAAFYGWTVHPDFLHFSSEILPVSLLAFANWMAIGALAGPRRINPSRAWAVGIGLAIGTAPLAKLQSVPPALVAGGFALFVVLRRAGRGRGAIATWLLISSLVPALVLLLPLAVSGALSDFFNSYVIASSQYLGQGLGGAKTRLLELVLRRDPDLAALIEFVALLGVAGLLAHRIRVARSEPGVIQGLTLLFGLSVIGAVVLAMDPVLLPGVLASLCILAALNDRSPDALAVRVYGVAMWGAAVFAVTAPGRPFPHYATLLVPFVALLAGVAFPLQPAEGRDPFNWPTAALLAALASILPITSLLSAANGAQAGSGLPLGPAGSESRFAFDWRAPRVYDWVAQPEDRLLVWGWMPQWYLWTGLTPATRETVTYRQIAPSGLRDYFRRRLLGELSRAPPEIIVDSVVGASFGFDWFGDSRIATFPELDALVRDDYEELHRGPVPNPACPHIYLRKDRMARLQDGLVRFAKITGTGAATARDADFGPDHVDDDSVTEDSCVDYWLLPPGSLGALRIEFTQPEQVRRIMILNTRGGRDLDRATRRVRLALYRSGMTVRTLELDLQPHPRWTDVELQRPWLADALGLEILSFDGAGAGLNEVKVFRERGESSADAAGYAGRRATDAQASMLPTPASMGRSPAVRNH